MVDKSAATKKVDLFEAEEVMIQLVGFEIGQESFGVDILMVQEIIRSARITKVPNSPRFVEGVINLRGGIIPVIDLRKRLNLFQDHAEGDKNWILILDIKGRVTGFIVDSVSNVLKIEPDSIEKAPEIVVSGLENQYIGGVCNLDDKLLIILDFNQILHLDEFRKLKGVAPKRD